MPAFFLLLQPSSAFEIVAGRILLSLVFCLTLVTVLRQWGRLASAIRDRRAMLSLAAAGVLIYINWQVFVLGALTGHIVETSLGYFINPIFTVLIGVVVLRERLRVAQWVAVGISAAAVLVIAIGYGAFPWYALTLAVTFGIYGYVKKQIGPRVDAIVGLTLETAWIAPFAAVQLVVVASLSGIEFGSHSALHTALFLLSGAVTAIPLILFAAGARRLPLVAVGFAQYLTPILQFTFGVVVMGEPMPFERWIGFSLVWAALVLIGIDGVRSGRPRRPDVTA